MWPELLTWEYFATLEKPEDIRNILWAFGIPVAAVFALVGTSFAFFRTRAAVRQSHAAEQGHITDRFTAAVQQLGDKSLAVRLGGVYALERIMQDSRRDQRTIVETLCAFVRVTKPEGAKGEKSPETSESMEGQGSEQAAGESGGTQERGEELAALRRIMPDAQAALNVVLRRNRIRDTRLRILLRLRIGLFAIRLGLLLAIRYGLFLPVRRHKNQKFRKAIREWNRSILPLRMNLAGSHLALTELGSGADLHGANLSDTNLNHSNFLGTDLSHADMTNAKLHNAILSHANLNYADLRGANLRRADLRGANLGHADLNGADLRDSNLGHTNLRRANLGHADLNGATLHEANLHGANLIDATLTGTDLGGVVLKNALGITQKMINEALLDVHTALTR